MSCKNFFLDQYNACYDEQNWFVPLMKSLDDMTPELANWKDGSTNHSILQLVHHIIFWNERYLFRFKDLPLQNMKESEIDPTFEINEKNWELTMEKLKIVLSELRDAINNASEEKLQSSPFKDSNDPWYSVIANINIHNAYHIGQIVFIRKLQGSWRK